MFPKGRSGKAGWDGNLRLDKAYFIPNQDKQGHQLVAWQWKCTITTHSSAESSEAAPLPFACYLHPYGNLSAGTSILAL